ncbi:Ig-like domain-containing protein [Salinisphaera sp. T31B1]|uniref:Ig-like domain-containing protein n=1 Tax=Salinisphaera sp. T31B1 TaxID=727963 RepID=UPI003341BC7E
MVVIAFDDTNGESVEREPWPYDYSPYSYFNYVSSVSYKVEAPVGSKIRITDKLAYKTKDQLAIKTSTSVKASDSFSFEGENYTGRVMAMPPKILPSGETLGDGELVKTTIEILASDGSVQETRTYNWMRDREPRVTKNEHPYPNFFQKYQDVSNLDERRADLVSAQPIGIEYGTSGTLSSLHKVLIEVKSLTTGKVVNISDAHTEYPSRNVGRVMIPTDPSIMPERKGNYRVIATIVDEAGNRTKNSIEFYFDAVPPAFEIIGVRSNDYGANKPWSHVSGLEKFVKYTPGLTVKDSYPVFLVRTRRNKHSRYSDNGLMVPTDAEYTHDYGCESESRFDLCVEKDMHEDGSYVYSVTGAAQGYTQHSASDYRVYARDVAGNWGVRNATVRVDSASALLPFVTAASLKFTNGETVEMYGTPGGRDWLGLVRNYSTNGYGQIDYSNVESVTVTAIEPAVTSHQIKLREATGGWYGQTTDTTVGTFNAGASQATFPLKNTTEPYRFCNAWGTNCIEYTFKLTTVPQERFVLADWAFGEYYSNAYTSRFYMDGYEVEILHQQTSRVSGELIATESRTGITHQVDLQYAKNGSNNNATKLYFRTENLPLTAYDFAVRVEGEDGETEVFQLESRDFTPADAIDPTVALSANGVPLKHAVIGDSGDIVVTVTDNLAGSSIESAKITGGPADKTLTASWTKANDTTYRITGPALSASAAANDYAITVVGIDAVGNRKVETVAFTVDGEKPSVSLRDGSAALSGASIDDVSDIRVRVTDNLPGADIKSAKIRKPNGSTVNASWSRLDSKNFRLTGPSLAASQSANDYTLTVVGEDEGGNTDSATASFTVDGIDPEVSLLVGSKALDGAVLTNAEQITIRVTDNLAGASLVSATFRSGSDGKTINADVSQVNATTYRASAPSLTGTSDYTLTVEAEDNAGNTVTDDASFIVDGLEPVLDLSSGGRALNGAALSPDDQIDVRITDDRSGADIQSIKVRAPNGKTTNASWQRVSTGNYRLSAPSGASGTYTITVVGVDAVGNSAQESASFTLDSDGPEVTLSSSGKALDSSVIAPGAKIRIAVTDNRAGADLQSVKLTRPDGRKVNMSWDRINSGTFEVTAPDGGKDDDYTIVAVAEDAVGNAEQASAAFTVDSIEPDVTLLGNGKPLGGSLLMQSGDIRVVVADNRSGTTIDSLEVTDSRGRAVATNWTRLNGTTFRLDTPNGGDYAINVTGADAVGNTSQASASFSIDGTKPSLALTVDGDPLEGAIFSPEGDIRIRLTDDRPDPEIQSAKLTGPGGKLVSSQWTRINSTTYRVGTPDDGKHSQYTLVVDAIDAAGNTEQVSATFTIDAIDPEVTLRADGESLDGALLRPESEIRIVVDDNRAGTSIQSLIVTGSDDRVIDASWSRVNATTFKLDTPAGDDYTIKVTGVDAVGNTTQVSAAFSVDDTKPNLAIKIDGEPLNGAIFSPAGEIRVQLGDDRPGAGLESVTLTGPSGKAVDVSWNRINSSTYVLATPDSGDHEYTYTVAAIDAAGNTAQLSARFTVDAIVPDVTLVSDGAPLAGAHLMPGDDIRIKVEDNRPDTRVVSASFTGSDGKSETAELERLDGTTLRVETPTMGGDDYTMNVVGADAVGNEASASAVFVLDVEPPAILIRAEGESLDGAAVDRTNVIQISVTDNYPGVDIQSATITGGPNGETVNATWTRVDDFTFRVTGPFLYASASANDYTIDVVGIDAVGITNRKSASFTYAPPAGEVAAGVNGGVAIIPGTKHAFTSIESEPFTRMDGSVLAGSHAVQATLRSGSGVGLVVNGVALAPGETKRVAKSFNFTASGGQIVLPVAARSMGDEGNAYVDLKIDAPGVGELSAPVEVWRANIDLQSAAWKVKQGFEEITIDAVADGATRCRLTRDEAEARQHDALSEPVCYLEWDELPQGLEAARVAEPYANSIGLRGFAEVTGKQDIEYSVWIFDEADDPYLMQQRRFKLDVVPPYVMGDFALEAREDAREAYRQVQTVNISLRQSEGEQCLLTLNEDEAISRSAMGRLTCLVEWTNMPSGLAQVEWFDTPNLTGILDTMGENLLTWDLSVFTPQGAKIKVNSQTLRIEVKDPPLPLLAMDDKERVVEGLYAASMDGGYLGDLKATSYSADLRLTLSREGEVYESVVAPGGWGDFNIAQRRVNADKRDLWTQTPYSAKAQYTELPTYKAEMAFKVLAVPSESISPEITVAEDEVLNTEPLAVTVRMNDPFADTGYDPESMGRWRVRIVRMEGLDSEPLTDYVPVPDSGETSFSIDLDDVESPRIRLSAQAELISPVPEYERMVLSPRPLYLTVLRGKGIEATVEGRRLSGLAPLTAVLSLDLDNRLDHTALGDVVWEMSDDKETWEPMNSQQLYATRMVHVFERGTYWVRANVTNANSGVKLRTPTVQVDAYLVPKVVVEGPENAFIGSTGHYTALAKDAQGEVVYEWSLDRGESWQSGTDTLDITRDEETRVSVYVRGRYENAPASDVEAWDSARTRLSFREPRGPNVRISGRSLIETGKSYDYQAIVRPPYRNMDITIGGRWTLPDGTKLEGAQMAYTPTREDLLNERIKLYYHAWIEGYEDQGAVDDAEQTLRIWQYSWPEFRFHNRITAKYAPADVVARLRSMTSTRIRELEEPVIEWEIPSGLNVTEEGTDAVRVFNVAEPGEYTLRAYIEDARGHSSTVEQTLVFGQAPDYAFDISYSASNRYNRAPMDIRVRPNVSGGHPRDRIQRYIYRLNDEQIDTDGRYGSMSIGEPGEHRVKVSIETEMGEQAIGELTIEAKENAKPSCEIESIGGDSYWRLSAQCDDEDGRVVGHEWYVNGDRVGLSGNRITVRNSGDGPPRVRMIGIDDGGARAPEAIWTGG